MPPKVSQKKLDKNLKSRGDDAIMLEPRETDLVIPVIGINGSGKSTFINAAIGKDVMAVGHELNSCTAQLQLAVLPKELLTDRPELRNRRVILLDTPGFDDTYVGDVEILRRITVWLSHSYNNGMKLAGIVYLHDISQKRVFGSFRKNFELFRDLCGKDAGKHVIFTTSQWSGVDPIVGSRREIQLKRDFWGEMMQDGARSDRFDGSPASAQKIVDRILEIPGDHIKIQDELVGNQMPLSETDAGSKARLGQGNISLLKHFLSFLRL